MDISLLQQRAAPLPMEDNDLWADDEDEYRVLTLFVIDMHQNRSISPFSTLVDYVQKCLFGELII